MEANVKKSELTDATAGPATDGTPVQVTDTTLESDTGPPLGPAADATLGSATDATPHQATDLTLAPLTRTSNNQQGRGLSFEQLMLASINRGSRATQKRKKVCDGAEIITGEEVLNRLLSAEEEKLKVITQKETKKEKQKIVVKESESSDEDDHYSTVQNKRMRTITNLFLLNLAVSDLLLGVLCMPFTLVGALLRDFIFGAFMCKLLPYLQACSVSVGVWTLVAISVERYYAICHPLRSLSWQTVNHAYKTIVMIWCGSFICMSPIAMLSQLQPTNQALVLYFVVAVDKTIVVALHQRADRQSLCKREL
ncbi:hypothetical protein RN001_003566 [Aquatica leii]|uniref:G-protein coupled receptors family 1 profile domain-containing protein n=1 Tax=Aquatica leii TaxID=1421715 RepID=A0AAN7ST19_9COLE|nr:hypothetical protein RN001_003566 [Aquatica leii]